MRVVFCVKDIKSNYRVTAYGDLAGLADDEDIGPFVGKELSFTIEQEFGDVRLFAERLPTGIVSASFVQIVVQTAKSAKKRNF